ncbi:3D domain-containing protein [Clostridium sp.]|jgi:uncharacterized protein YabE (DUF348 family)|uniref:3D domain-containing protein n=1 Tax=Clostridium sp. TaxID=1506 RepID=UPI0025887D96|nr:3D domain-containing protein [Clostridium sp.]MDF2505611.1 hypothetical protein [Clostridium sp.]
MFKKLKDNFFDFKSYFSKGSIMALVMVIIILSVTIYARSMRKVVTVSLNGETKKVISYKNTVKDILEQNNIKIEPKDKIKPSVDIRIKSGQEIYIKKAVGLELLVDGKDIKVKSGEDSVEDMLKAECIKLSDSDKVKPSKNDSIKNGMKVVVTRVSTQKLVEAKPIDFETVVQNDNNMGNDEKQVIQQGVAGSKEIITNVTYEDGKEVARNIVSEVVKSEPVKAVVKVGTLGVVNANRGGKATYKSKINAKATAYTADLRFGITASGTRTKRDSNGYSSIAVDPRVIPLGTKLYVPGYGYGIAEDTGGLIKGNRIDLFFTSETECENWGIRPVDVYILK